ncbi:hypothetical protein GBA52_013306 [Prunus armeniaca]|nr:hypothetical protein GBA52_013306 [Prunus armeniaca]
MHIFIFSSYHNLPCQRATFNAIIKATLSFTLSKNLKYAYLHDFFRTNVPQTAQKPTMKPSAMLT